MVNLRPINVNTVTEAMDQRMTLVHSAEFSFKHIVYSGTEYSDYRPYVIYWMPKLVRDCSRGHFDPGDPELTTRL